MEIFLIVDKIRESRVAIREEKLTAFKFPSAIHREIRYT